MRKHGIVRKAFGLASLLVLAGLPLASSAVAAESPPAFITKWGSNGSGEGQFSYPVGVATDSSGNVYVVDHYNHRIQKFDAQGRYLAQGGGFGTGPGQFQYAASVAVDAQGTLVVVDAQGKRLQKIRLR